MLRTAIVITLAASAAAMPVAGSAVDDQLAKLTIKGSLTYDAGLTLPPDSRAVVELRHLPELPSAPPVATKPISLEGKQTPVAFEFAVERFKLVAGGTYVVRGAVLSGTGVVWRSEDTKIDTTTSTVEVGSVTLVPAKAGGE